MGYACNVTAGTERGHRSRMFFVPAIECRAKVVGVRTVHPMPLTAGLPGRAARSLPFSLRSSARSVCSLHRVRGFPFLHQRRPPHPVNTVIRLAALLAFASPIFSAGFAAEHTPTARDAEIIAAVIAADNERIAATSAADPARLETILSDELRYAHSNGAVDHKASTIDLLVSRRTVYRKFDYKERTVLPAAPGIALMSGRVVVDLLIGERTQEIDLNYLAVWRNENGKWRFLSWQSCRNPAPATPGAKP